MNKSYSDLFQKLTQDVVVLTANRRLANYLLAKYDQWRSESSSNVWPTPTILPLNRWILEQWQIHADDSDDDLDDFAEQCVWQNIIQASPIGQELSQLQSTALHVQQAWELTQNWQWDLVELSRSTHPETQAFIQWANTFKAWLASHHYCSRSEIPKRLITFFEKKSHSLPNTLYFVGFDDHPPIIQRLIETIQNHCPVIHYHQPIMTPSKIFQVGLTDTKEELITAARWIQEQRERYPDAFIGCIVPELTEIRAPLVRIFNQYCPRYTISAGQSLNEFPMMSDALHCLSITENLIDQSTLTTLLTSPYFNSATEDALLAAQLDETLRKQQQFKISLSTVTHTLNLLSQNYPQSTLEKRWQAWLSTRNTEKNYTDWAHQFQQQLTAIGWPGQRSLTSLEYQLHQRWNALLLEFAKLDRYFEPPSLQQALRILRQLMTRTIFQPESESESVQILGLLESTGLCFDHVWAVGFDDQHWPPSSRPNPFLPLELQRQYKMPHASYEREDEYSQQLQQRLEKQTHHLILSYPLQKEDQRLKPSYLIEPFPEITREELFTGHQPKTLLEKCFGKNLLETVEDDCGPAMNETESPRGGSSILQHQAACPFQAFAKIRLNARSLEEPIIGISAKEHGTLVHEVLQNIWKQIKNHENLLKLNEESLLSIIYENINKIEKKLSRYEPTFQRVQRKRLEKLLLAWLDAEKSRPSFKVIERETTRNVNINGLPLTLKIDRIDELADGSYLIIDYKTGTKADPAEWLNQPPQALQLPLYATFAATRADGISFGMINEQKMNFKGMINKKRSKQVFFDIVPTDFWEEQQDLWRKAIHKLANDFREGKAAVSPFHQKTCETCDLHSLCRVELS